MHSISYIASTRHSLPKGGPLVAYAHEARWILHDAAKRPLSPHTGLCVSPHGRGAGVTYPEAVGALLAHENASGVGILLGNGIAAVDLDGHGVGSSEHRKVIAALGDTATERSRSGTGLHLFYGLDGEGLGSPTHKEGGEHVGWSAMTSGYIALTEDWIEPSAKVAAVSRDEWTAFYPTSVTGAKASTAAPAVNYDVPMPALDDPRLQAILHEPNTERGTRSSDLWALAQHLNLHYGRDDVYSIMARAEGSSATADSKREGYLWGGCCCKLDPNPTAGFDVVPPPHGAWDELMPLTRLTAEELEGLAHNGWLLPGTLTVLAGAPKAGKSTFAMGLAVGLARGEDFVGIQPVHPCRVVYIAAEAARVTSHIGAKVAGDTEINLRVLALNGRKLKESDFGYPDVDLYVIDPMINALPGVDNENDNVQVANSMERVTQWLGKAAGLMIHHFGKQGDSARGASSIYGQASEVWVLKPTEDGLAVQLEGQACRLRSPKVVERTLRILHGVDQIMFERVDRSDTQRVQAGTIITGSIVQGQYGAGNRAAKSKAEVRAGRWLELLPGTGQKGIYFVLGEDRNGSIKQWFDSNRCPHHESEYGWSGVSSNTFERLTGSIPAGWTHALASLVREIDGVVCATPQGGYFEFKFS